MTKEDYKIAYENVMIANKMLEQENKQLKELKYKFFDNCGDEESFTLEDYLEISNKLYDYEQENKQLKENKKKVIECLNKYNQMHKEQYGYTSLYYDELLKRIGGEEDEI